MDIEVAEPFTARSLVLYPAEMQFAAQCELQAAGEDGAFRTVRQFPLDRSNTNVQRGADASAGRWRSPFPPRRRSAFGWSSPNCAARAGWRRSSCPARRGWSGSSRSSLARCIPRRCRCGTLTCGRRRLSRKRRAWRLPPGAVLEPHRQAGRRRHAALGCAGGGLDHPPHRHDADGHPQCARLARRPGARGGQDEPRRRPGAFRGLHRQAPGADAEGRPQGLQARRRRQLRDGLAELDGRFQRPLPQALWLRPAALAAGADGPRRGQRRPVGPFPVGPAAAGGRPYRLWTTSAVCATPATSTG